MKLVRFGGPPDWYWGAVTDDGEVRELPTGLLPQPGAALTIEKISELRGIQFASFMM